jgi:D-3-phosphoglycerate dehydrogenase
MKVLVADSISEDALKGLKDLGVEVVEKTDIEHDELLNDISNYDGIIVRSRTMVRKDIIGKAAGKLKFIVRAGVGLDNIDVDYALEMGIEVMNTPEASTNGVAELTIGHMLSLLRNIPRGTSSTKKKEWIKKELVGHELGGMTVGIIGMGRIGKRTALLLHCFGSKILGYDPYVDKMEGSDIEMVDIDELLNRSDIVSLHIPHSEETHHMIGKEELRKMKNSAYLINCARGGIVDEEALYEALKNGDIAGAALDVFEVEPPRDSKLMELDNFICTPHLGAQAVEAKNRVGEEVVKKVASKL